MAEKTIKLDAFTGMNNIKAKEGKPNEPRIVLNADVTDEGRVVKRDGTTRYIVMTDPHSLWAGTQCMLCLAPGALYRLDSGAAVSLGSATGPKSPATFVEINSKVYASNKHWSAVYDIEKNSLDSWGQTVPTPPVCVYSATGTLPAGTYHVAYTHIDADGLLSGSSTPTTITLTAIGGISLVGRTATDIVWCSDPNGFELYRVGPVDLIATEPPTVEPLPTFLCYPPLKFENLCFAFGRMWGSKDDKVYWSEPHRVDLWKLHTSFFKFDQSVRMIARVSTGLFIGCEDKTYFLGGTEPLKMEMGFAGEGVLQGTLSYCNNLKELGDVISPAEKVHVAVPIWVTQKGIVAGNPSGRIFDLTQKRVKFSGANHGASLFRNKDGKFQFLTSFKQGQTGSAVGFSDSATVEVIRNGQVI